MFFLPVKPDLKVSWSWSLTVEPDVITVEPAALSEQVLFWAMSAEAKRASDHAVSVSLAMEKRLVEGE